MKILQNANSNVNFSGLVPKKSYKGPLLKLTETDKKKISALQENIVKMELELYDLSRIYDNKKLTTEKLDYIWGIEERLKARIESLRENINAIKINRIKMQGK